jgi:membrane-associated phospholipid phosphatase
MTQRIARTTSIVWRNGLADLLLLAFAFMLYSLVRMGSSGQQIEATYNAVDLFELERALFIGHENASQDLILWSEPLIHIFNSIYTYGHFWLIGVAAVWLFYWHRDTYTLFRNAFFISGAIGLICFNLFPLAPPRLLPGDYGAVDTLRLFSNVNYENTGAFVNEYAAIPSLHVAWNMLISLAIASVVKNRAVQVWAFCMPLLMSITVVVTGNHWILDAVAGYIVGMIGLAGALLLRREGWRFRAFFRETFVPPQPASVPVQASKR